VHDIFKLCVIVVVAVVVVEQSVASTDTNPLVPPIASSHPTALDPLPPTPRAGIFCTYVPLLDSEMVLSNK
jgi:hypothetical protein